MANVERASQVIARAGRLATANAAEAERLVQARKPKRRTEQTRVHGAYSGTDKTERVVDTLKAMLNRRQISQLEYQAGERLQAAGMRIEGSVGNVMDFDRTRGGGSPGQPPAMTYLLASETIRLSKAKLYPRDYAVVWRVCVQGLGVEQCGYLFAFGRTGREEAGRALRRGLGELAEMWWPGGRKARQIRTYRPLKSVAGDASRTEAAKFYCAG